VATTPDHLRSRHLVQSPQDGAIGRITLAGTIRDSRGVSFDNMRILGSYALVYLLDGGGWFVDAAGRERRVSAGDLIIVFPDVAHAYGPNDARGERWSEIYVVFDGPVFDTWRTRGLLDPARPVLRLEPIAYWLRRLEGVVADHDEPIGPATAPSAPPAGQALRRVCLLQQFLADALAYHHERRVADADRTWLARAQAAIDDVPADGELNYEAVSRRLGVSYATFRKRFAKLAGSPPAKYRAARVAEQACALLHRSDLPLRAVAERCGFCDEFHFSRRFKQLVGVSPTEFRRRLPTEGASLARSPGTPGEGWGEGDIERRKSLDVPKSPSS
jgi:AraC-like DNA-binding protein